MVDGLICPGVPQKSTINSASHAAAQCLWFHAQEIYGQSIMGVQPGLLQTETNGIGYLETTLQQTILLYKILGRGVEQQGVNNTLDTDKTLLRELFAPTTMNAYSYLRT